MSDHMSSVPPEIIETIVEFCDFHGSIAFSRTSKRYHQLVLEECRMKKRAEKKIAQFFASHGKRDERRDAFLRTTLGSYWRTMLMFLTTEPFDNVHQRVGTKSSNFHELFGKFENGTPIRIEIKIDWWKVFVGGFSATGDGVGMLKDGKDVYIGQFKKWRFHGVGQLTDHDGIIYEGQFESGHKNGTGKIFS